MNRAEDGSSEFLDPYAEADGFFNYKRYIKEVVKI
jgi:hypothetical protein